MIRGSTIINTIKKFVVWDKSLNIYTNGVGNNYPDICDQLRNESVTAVMASRKMIQIVIGKGFGVYNDIKIKGLRLIEIAEDLVRDIVNERGAFVLVNYNALYEIDNFSVVDFKKCRVGEKDDRKYNGKILVSETWCEGYKKDKVKVYDVYNPDPKVIKSQVEKAGGWESYKGQIYFYSMDRNLIYPLSRIHPVLKDCENEELSSTYKNRVLKFGFFGKTIFITRPLVGKKPKVMNAQNMKEYQDQETERSKFKKMLQSLVGVEETGNSMHVELDFAGEKLSDAMHIQTIESNVEPDLFDLMDKSSFEKILMSFNNLPADLIKSSGSSVFGNSGGLIKEMTLNYQRDTEIERDATARILNEFWLRMPHRKKEEILKIETLIKEEKKEDKNDTTSEPAN